MRKEAVLAIIAGLGLGLIIAFGVWRMNLFSKKPGVSTSTNPSPAPPLQTGLTIAKPNNDDVITTNLVTISGLASPDSWIIVSGNSNDYLFKTDPDGAFDGEIKLAGGINLLVVTAINKDSGQTSQTLRLIYSSQLATAEPAASPTSTESATKEKVEARVEGVLNSPKAYLGTVTDITDTTIQLKSDKGEIQQVSVGSNVKITDIAIGDYIAALGTTGGNHVLVAKRILITSPQKPANIKIYLREVKEIKKKEITLEEIKFTTKLTGLKVGDLVIVVGEVDEAGKFTPRKSFLAAPAASPSPTPKI